MRYPAEAFPPRHMTLRHRLLSCRARMRVWLAEGRRTASRVSSSGITSVHPSRAHRGLVNSRTTLGPDTAMHAQVQASVSMAANCQWLPTMHSAHHPCTQRTLPARGSSSGPAQCTHWANAQPLLLPLTAAPAAVTAPPATYRCCGLVPCRAAPSRHIAFSPCCWPIVCEKQCTHAFKHTL